MYRFLLLISLWCCSIIASVAQSISLVSIVEPSSNYYLCPNKNLVVAYLTSGVFNADNKFTLQLEYSDNLGSAKDLLTLETKDSLGFLVGKIPSTIFSYLKDRETSSFKVQIASSSPVVKASLSGGGEYIPIGELPDVTITQQQGKVYMPPNGSAIVSMSGKGSGLFTLTATDGRKFVTTRNIYAGLLSSQIVLSTQKSETITFSTIQNMCGIGKISGKIDAVVTTNFLKIASLEKRSFCKNSDIQLIVNKIGTWNASNKYTIELTSTLSNTIYTIEATEKEGIVTGKIPLLLNTGSYTARVYTSSPEVSSNSYSIDIYDAPQISIQNTGSTTIAYGEKINLKFAVTGGSYPINYELSDGTKGTFYTSYYPFFELSLTPKSTQTYKLKNVSGVCGIGSGTGEFAVNITDGVILKSLEKSKYCMGDTLRANFTSNRTLVKGTPITAVIKLVYAPEAGYMILLGTVKQEGIAEFILQKNMTPQAQPFSMGLTTTSISTVIFKENVATLNKKPSVSIFEPRYGVSTLNNPGFLNYDLTILGGDRITYQNSLGETFTTNSPFNGGSTYFSKSTAFQITSVSNICGVNNTPSKMINVVVNNPEKINLITPFTRGAEICAGSKQNLTIEPTGVFNSDNKFYLDLVEASGSIVKEGIAEFVNNKAEWIVSSAYDLYPQTVYLQVRATSPSITAQKMIVKIVGKPAYKGLAVNDITYTSGSYSEMPILGCSNVYNFSAKLQDGRVYNGIGAVTIDVDPQKSSIFKVNSLSNVCGNTDVDITYRINYINKYVIFHENTSTPSQIVCKGQNVNIRYYEAYPNIDEPAYISSYRLEISKTSQFDNPLILKNNITVTEINVQLPESLDAGTYYLRLVDIQNSAIFSGVKTILYQFAPTIKVSTADGKSEYSLKNGEDIEVKKDPMTEEYIYNDQGYSFFMEAQGAQNRFTPPVSGVYRISSSINQCGMLDNPLVIKVSKVPEIRWRTNMVMTDGNSFCAGTKFLFYVYSSSNETSNKFSLSIADQSFLVKKIPILETTRTGWQWVEIPKTTPYGTYRMEMTAQNGDVYRDGSSESFSLNTPPMLNMLGNITINYGQSGYVTLIPQTTPINTFDKMYYELSDGSTGTILYPENSGFTVSVSPKTSQNIKFTKVSNMCGVGEVKGSAQVTVNPESNKQIENSVPFKSKFCAGSKVEIMYTTKGNFSNNAKFEVQISDKNGQNFKTINSAPIPNATNYLSATLPVDLPEGNEYRFKVISSEANSTGASTMSPLSVASVITAEFDTTKYFYSSADKPVTLKVNAKGKFPIGVYIGPDGLTSKYYEISKSPFEIPFLASTAKQFQIFRVYNNECGEGSVGAKNIATLELVTGLEDIQSLGVVIGPNPASDYIAINCDEPNVKAEIFDMLGQSVFDAELHAGKNQISLQSFANGVYHLKVSKGNKSGTFKLMKF